MSEEELQKTINDYAVICRDYERELRFLRQRIARLEAEGDSLIKRWKYHLLENGMTYRQHLAFAGGHGLRCIVAGVLLVTHSLLPCFWRRTGSVLVARLQKDFREHNRKSA